MNLEDYAIRIEPLPRGEGGGFLVTVPDLPGCVGDGETIEAAIAEAHDAFQAWAMAERQDRGELPVPKTYSGQSAKKVPAPVKRTTFTPPTRSISATAESTASSKLAAPRSKSMN